MLGASKEKDDADAADPHDVVDHRDVDLALGLGRVVDVHVGHEVQAHGLRDDGVGAGDQGLGRDDGGEGREDDGEDAQVLGEHLVEGVEVGDAHERGVRVVGDDPGALAEVVDDQARLDEGPGGVDVRLAHVAHVGVEGLGAGGAEEDVAEDHEAGGVEVAVKEERDAAHGVERAQDAEVADDVREAGDAQEEEPQRHHGAEELADGGGAGLLHGEQHAQDGDGDGDDDVLVVADEGVAEVDRAQALDGRRDGDGRSQDAVGKKRRAADHGGDDQPFAAALDQAVEGKDAALVVVVGLHGDEDVLDRGDEGQGPDDEGEGSQHDVRAHRGKTAVAAHDRLQGVHRAGADVTVDDAKRDVDHAGGQRDPGALRLACAHVLRSALN